ncbi:methyltransferase-like protein 25B isoform X1 [Drosophila biarmipes]|uniref:methyltransferase-like protein 25B isoform X1 n=2 Tax=Drosophila biarmipes TaxID=125945 RepID=UPI0007E7BDE2|nr:methyltransferase-like protein 25B isoform X1 [Drosophila biarmipes]
MLFTKEKLDQSLGLLKKYEWLLDSYVLDFFLDDHWSKLPENWQQHLENIPLDNLEDLLQNEDHDMQLNWPLDLMDLWHELRKLCIGRAPKKQIENSVPCPLLGHPKLKHMFLKRVKPKKQHEVRRMAEICALSHRQTPVDFVLDFGAGVGHLARILGYGYGVQVCCLEMQPDLNQQAGEIDLKLESMAAKHLSQSETRHFRRPLHLTQRLESNTQPADFLSSIREALQLEDDKFRFGIIGLHPCGNLGPTLMRIFLGCPQAMFLNFVGCCYQKMTTQPTHPREPLHGYPLSIFLKDKPGCQLSYEAREISCHAMEVYSDRLRAGDYEHLRIHSLRAAAERIIVQQFPDLRHCALRNVRHSPGMTFHQYFQKAVQGTRFEALDSRVLSDKQTETDLANWQRIVSFYTLRLMMAPLVESIILHDRCLFLMENGCQVQIEALFDPRLSPRNHITMAVKP